MILIKIKKEADYLQQNTEQPNTTGKNRENL